MINNMGKYLYYFMKRGFKIKGISQFQFCNKKHLHMTTNHWKDAQNTEMDYFE